MLSFWRVGRVCVGFVKRFPCCFLRVFWCCLWYCNSRTPSFTAFCFQQKWSPNPSRPPGSHSCFSPRNFSSLHFAELRCRSFAESALEEHRLLGRVPTAHQRVTPVWFLCSFVWFVFCFFKFIYQSFYWLCIVFGLKQIQFFSVGHTAFGFPDRSTILFHLQKWRTCWNRFHWRRNNMPPMPLAARQRCGGGVFVWCLSMLWARPGVWKKFAPKQKLKISGRVNPEVGWQSEEEEWVDKSNRSVDMMPEPAWWLSQRLDTSSTKPERVPQ